MADAETKYGRTADEWDQLIDAGTKFLIERAKLGKTTSYTELNATLVRRTGLRAFDFAREDERAAMGYLLGSIVERSYPSTGIVISALVLYLGENDAGTGFYALAQDYGLLPRGASRQARWEFWLAQVNAIFAKYK